MQWADRDWVWVGYGLGMGRAGADQGWWACWVPVGAAWVWVWDELHARLQQPGTGRGSAAAGQIGVVCTWLKSLCSP